MITYREVLCPYCDKKFMLNKDEYSEYYLKENKKIANMATCTKCNTKLAIFDSVLEGVPEEDLDNNVKKSRIFKL